MDNPFVPDMISVRSQGGALGRGYSTGWGQSYAIVAAGALVPSVPSFVGTSPVPTYRIDRHNVLDVFTVDRVPALQTGAAACQPFISPVFDRDVANLGDIYRPQAIGRKSLGRRSNGVEILQRTRTSSRDLDYREPLTRSLRK